MRFDSDDNGDNKETFGLEESTANSLNETDNNGTEIIDPFEGQQTIIIIIHYRSFFR